MNVGVDERHLKMRDESARSSGPVIGALARGTANDREARAGKQQASPLVDAGSIDEADGVRLRTHWTRILSVDLFNRKDSPSTDALPPSSTFARRHHEDVEMQRKHADFEGSPRFKSPMTAAAVLVGIYAAMHLAVGGVLHALSAPAVAAMPAAATKPLLPIDDVTDPVRAGEMRPNDTIERAANPAAMPAPCAHGAPAHLECRMD